MLSPETAADAILHALGADRSSVPVEINIQPESHLFFSSLGGFLLVTCKSSRIGNKQISCYAGFSDVMQIDHVHFYVEMPAHRATGLYAS